jgi:hypothetical protein
MGSWAHTSAGHFDLGVQYVKFRSSSNAELHGRPDLAFPEDNIATDGGHFHRFWGEIDAVREFEGVGPSVSWAQSLQLMGDAEKSGRVGVEFGLGGSVLFGKQKAQTSGFVRGDYHIGVWAPFVKYDSDGNIIQGLRQLDAYNTPFSHRRSQSTTVPSINASLGLNYTLGGLKLSGGYRVERYFDAIDAGIAERKTYDRQFDGPYFKVAVGFGG